MDVFRPKRARMYRIVVQHTENGPWREVYRGPWSWRADHVWKYGVFVARRVYWSPLDSEVQATLYGHPDLTDLEEELDRWYTVEGDPNDPPNRIADFERLELIQKAEGKAA